MDYLVENFEVKFDVSIILSSAQLTKIPKLIIKSTFNDICLVFNPMTYKMILDIGKAFELEEDILQKLITDKETIIKYNKKAGAINVYDTKMEKWKIFQTVVSGSYIYFYEKNLQLYPTSYFYLENAELKSLPKMNQYYPLNVFFKSSY